ncbi:hypothetical protein ACFXJ8_32535 [Nonomuraea sp. NPDC059194]|uniref:hypothetical protein n=1 Tax=Nonomuraea sp. NPDC059194 TaxID=3346764 RepID=UPI0036997340
MSAVEPRHVVRPDSASTLQWLRMVYREYGGRKGLLRDGEIGRDALELAMGVAMTVNGRTGVSEVGVKYIARMAGYSGNGHDMYGQLRHLLMRGFLTKDGEGGKGGKIPRLKLSMPVTLVEPYSKVKNGGFGELLDSLDEETVAVSDLRMVQQKPSITPPATGGQWQTGPYYDPFKH